MSVSFSSRALLVVLTVFAIVNAAAAFMCYKRAIWGGKTSKEFCRTGTCFKIGGNLGNFKGVHKGCHYEPHPPGCEESSIGGHASGYKCFCTTSLCNSAFTPSIGLPLLVLPAVLQYFL